MSRSSKALRIPFVAEVADAIRSIRGLDKEIDGLDASARAAQESFKNAGDATDDAFAGAQGSVDAAERSMRALGIKSEQVADNQIAHLRQSFETLKASGAASTKEIERAYQNMQAKIARINAQIGRDAKRTFSQVAKDASAKLRQIGNDMTSIGASLSMKVTAPVVLGFGAALKVAGDFEAKMQGVRALLGNVSDQEFADLNKAARDLGKSTKFSASETAGAIEILASQGLNTQQILGGALKATADTAAASGSTIEEAANLVTQASNVFGIETGKMGQVADRAVGLMDVSRFGVNDFGLALSQGGLAARQAKLSFEEFAAVMALNGKYFDSGSDAGTSFKTFMASLSKTSKPAQEAMKRIGFSAYDASGKFVGMEEVIRRLQRSLRGLSDQEKSQVLNDIFGSDAGREAFALATEGVEGYGRALNSVFNGSAAKAAETRMKGFKGSFEEFTGALEELGIAIMASGILETITNLVKSVTEFITKLSETSPGLLKFGTYAALATAAIGPILMGLGQMAIGAAIVAKALAILIPILGGITLIGAGWAIAIGLAIGAVVSLIWVYREQIINALGDAWRWIRENAAAVGGWILASINPFLGALWQYRAAIVGAIGSMLTWLRSNWQALLSFFASLGSPLYQILVAPFMNFVRGALALMEQVKRGGYSLASFFRGMVGFLYEVLIAPYERFYQRAKALIEWVIAAARRAASWLGYTSGKATSSRGYASGGYTGNVGVRQIAGFVHGREFVLRAAAVRQYPRAMLEAMNRGTWRPEMPLAYADVGAGAGAGGGSGLTPIVLQFGADAINVLADRTNYSRLLEREHRRKSARSTQRKSER